MTYLDRVATAFFSLVLIGNQFLAQFISLVSRRSLLTFNPPYTTASTLLASYASTCLVQPTLFSSPFPIAAALLPFSLLSSKFVASSKSISRYRPRSKHPVQDSAHNRQAILNALAATARRFQEISRRKEPAEAFGIPKLARFRYVHFSSLCPSSSSQSLDPLLSFTLKSVGGTALASQCLKILAISLTDACVPVVCNTKTIWMPAILSFPTDLQLAQSVTCITFRLKFSHSHYVCTRQPHRPLPSRYQIQHCALYLLTTLCVFDRNSQLNPSPTAEYQPWIMNIIPQDCRLIIREGPGHTILYHTTSTMLDAALGHPFS